MGERTLYCFMLDDNYKLHKWAVENYRYTPSTGWGGKPYYSFTANGKLYHVKEQDFDIYKHGKYVSFKDDRQAAVKAITMAYIVRLEKAEANCRRLTGVVNTIKEQGL